MIFWVHSWVDNFEEIKIGKSFKSSEEMAEVACDIGVQLGRGHVKQIAAPFDYHLRKEQLRIINSEDAVIKTAIVEFADRVVDAWSRFKSEF